MEKCNKCGVEIPSDFLDKWNEGNIKDIIKQGYCFDCAFWIDIINELYNKDKSIIIKGEHYYNSGFKKHIKNDVFMGFGGRLTFIRMDNGNVIKTNDLWHQGKVPKHFKDVLKDNAKFISEAEYKTIKN